MNRIARSIVMMIGVLAVASSMPALAEEMTLTTYYPSPRGMYDGLRTNTLYTRGGDGDFDQNGMLTASDVQAAMLCARVAVPPPQGPYPPACSFLDLNGDGLVVPMESEALLSVWAGTRSIEEARTLTRKVASTALITDLDGNVGVGVANPKTPAPNGATAGNLDVNDVYVRGVRGGSPRWVSESLLGDSNLTFPSPPDTTSGGYQRFGNGLLIQWGRVTETGGGTVTVRLPTPFVNNRYIVVTGTDGASENSVVFHV